MLKAVIDLGTNTFNLLVARWYNNQLESVFSTKEGVALGMGGILNNEISPEAKERAIECLKKFRKICDSLEVTEIRAIGTSALRDAKNNRTFCEQVYAETGIFIEIVSGLREADLIWKGISYSHTFTSRSLVMDIGGGSTEFILASERGILQTASFNIGVSRILQARNFQDPMNIDDIRYIEEFLENNTQAFFETLQVDTLIGASGSFETFFEMHNKVNYPQGFSTQTMPFDQFITILEELIKSTQAERDHNPFILPIRKKMAPIAAVKTRWVVQKLKAKNLIISPCSLKEGVLVEMEL